MPYINVHIGKTLSKEEEQKICELVHKNVSLIPGKSPQNTMVDVQSGCSMKMGEETACTFINVHLLGAAPAEAKNAFTQAVTAELEKEFGLSKNSMYINITEMSAWGMGGGFHSM